MKSLRFDRRGVLSCSVADLFWKWGFAWFAWLCLDLAYPLFLAAPLWAEWEGDQRLTYDDSTSFLCGNHGWSVAASGDTVHVVWYDNRDVNEGVYYKRSLDAGTTWESDTRLTITPHISERPSIAVRGSAVHIVWHDTRDFNYEIYYKRSTDGGTSWEADTRLTDDRSYSAYPSVAVADSFVHVVWHEERDGYAGEVYYKRSTDGGTTWDPDARLTNDPGGTHRASVAAFGQDVHVVWYDDRDGNYEIYYKHSGDGGITWEPDTRLTDDSAESRYPSVAVSDSIVHIVWFDRRYGGGEILYRHSTDGGALWEPDTRLTFDPDSSHRPSVAALGRYVHVVWWDNRDRDTEVYYKRSTDGGITWEADTRLTDHPGLSDFPSVAVSGSKVHVVWEDSRDGNYEIYYKRNPRGQPSAGVSCLLNLYQTVVPSSATLAFCQEWVNNDTVARLVAGRFYFCDSLGVLRMTLPYPTVAVGPETTIHMIFAPRIPPEVPAGICTVEDRGTYDGQEFSCGPLPFEVIELPRTYEPGACP